ncbi:hypothetical protein JTB14_010289 [Gonioctena quinquepunctata]|nr:hypothetical protein JTB14_010289 [Gonioctena quinquepunctata]
MTISSGFAINEDKFKIYALKTVVIYLKYYPWYNVQTTIHRVLIHDDIIIIRDAIAPIGLLSEDAQESKNEAIKTYRKGYTRKFPREQTMEDLFHQLLVSSDPYITNMRELPQKKSRTYPEDVMMLLKKPAVE